MGSLTFFLDYTHDSLEADLHTFPLTISKENLTKDQSIIFAFGEHFTNSHNLSVDDVRRKEILATTLRT